MKRLTTLALATAAIGLVFALTASSPAFSSDQAGVTKAVLMTSAAYIPVNPVTKDVTFKGLLLGAKGSAVPPATAQTRIDMASKTGNMAIERDYNLAKMAASWAVDTKKDIAAKLFGSTAMATALAAFDAAASPTGQISAHPVA